MTETKLHPVIAGRTVVVIGNFDGVHQGHQAVLRAAQNLSDLPVVVVTFWPHPLAVLAPGHAPKLLTDLHTRIDLLKQAGAREVRVVQFTRELSWTSPEEFVERIIKPLRPATVVVGDNFRFGSQASGDTAELRRLGEGSFDVVALKLLGVEDTVTCSTRIREALVEGDVASAAKHLGRWFRYRGVVVVGDQRGRELGFPTANLLVPDEMAVPADGVYAGWVTRLHHPGAEPMPAAISVGSNPTFNGFDRRVESYVLDRDDLELYGTEIAVDFVEHLRGQVKFTGAEALIEQMHRDVEQTRALLTR